MPIYSWLDKKSGTKVEVIRSFDEYEQHPTEEEAPGLTEPEWERIIDGKRLVTRPVNWEGKGNW
jgi:hypothetical protein